MKEVKVELLTHGCIVLRWVQVYGFNVLFENNCPNVELLFLLFS